MKPITEESVSPEVFKKYSNLLDHIRNLGRIAVAYSGGVDSTFLLAAANQAPARQLVALTMQRPYFAQWELREASEIVQELGITHRILEIPVDENIRENPSNRCYYCKSFTFDRFWDEVESLGLDTLVDGTNADDTGEYRPGLKAVEEYEVRSPLLENGLTKSEIRQLSRAMDLPVWDKPSNTCLITRIPYNTYVSDADLRQIEEAEVFLMKEGFKEVRVRKHDDIARIEVDPGMISKLAQSEVMNKVVPYFKSLGFRYVSLDLEGYKTGSMDQAILENQNDQ